MGTWGTGIYSNDIAADVKEMCAEIFPFLSIEEGNKLIFDEYDDLINSSVIDNEYASFWYALADWQWNHGVLSDLIKERTLELLYNYVGISDWVESACKPDVKKRKSVLDQLRKKLETPQPPLKLPKVRLEKPKHKRGDIVVFQMDDSKKGFDRSWKIEYLRPTYIYASEKISNAITEKFTPPKDLSRNYAAIICVGTVKERYSHYIDNVYNEKSVYAIYNYCKYDRPTLDTLSKCGFLPHIAWSSNAQIGDNYGITESIEWEYKYTFICESFRKNSNYLGECYILHCDNEANRFEYLLSRKSYSNDYLSVTDLEVAYMQSNEEKLRLLNVDIYIDDLLDTSIKNPDLNSPDHLDRIRGGGKYSE